MIRISLRTAVLMAGLAVVSVAGTASAQDKPAQTIDPNQVVATVNGEKITASDVLDARSRLSPQYQGVPMDAIFGPLLTSLVDIKLAAAEARKQGLEKDPDVVSTLARVEEQVLQRALLGKKIESTVSDDAVKARYDEFLKTYEGKDEVHARHILVESEEQAKEIVAELDKGADFAELAKKRSIGPSASKGGDLGFFPKEAMVAPFADAAFALENGKYTAAPVQTQFGWHVILREESRTGEAPKFEEVAPQIREELSAQAASELIEGLRKDAKIEKFNIDGTPMKEKAE